MGYATIIYEKKEKGASITLNRPEALNALNSQVNRELAAALEEAERDESVRVIILTGAGEKAFAAGADIKEMIQKTALEARQLALQGKAVADKLYYLKKPSIAAINGFCLGGGLEIALACDIRVASENAKFGLPEITLGIMPGNGGTQRLPRLIGMGPAKEMALTGGMIDARKALELKLINHVYPLKSLIEEALKLANKIANNSPIPLSLIKTAMNRGTEMNLEQAGLFEIDCFALCFTCEDQKEGMEAFVEKRKPDFKGK